MGREIGALERGRSIDSREGRRKFLGKGLGTKEKTNEVKSLDNGAPEYTKNVRTTGSTGLGTSLPRTQRSEDIGVTEYLGTTKVPSDLVTHRSLFLVLELVTGSVQSLRKHFLTGKNTIL